MSVFSSLKQKIQFGQIPLLQVVNPLYLVRRNLFLALRRHATCFKGTRCLDVGCGSKPYESLFEFGDYIGIDVEISGHDHSNSIIDVFYDGKNIPFEDDSFSHIFCSEVLEHVEDPLSLIKEMHRVLAPGGKMLVTVPFIWPVHEAPYDFYRYTKWGIESVLRRGGFGVNQVDISGGTLTVLLQLFVEYLHGLAHQRSKFMSNFITLPLIIPLNIIGFLLTFTDRFFPKHYFNTIILAQKK